jgi:hypothetical protein
LARIWWRRGQGGRWEACSNRKKTRDGCSDKGDASMWA